MNWIKSPTTALVTLTDLEITNLTLGSTVTLSLVLLTTVLLSELLAKTVLDKLPAAVTLTTKVTVADLPASILQNHPNVTIYCDEEASELLVNNLK